MEIDMKSMSERPIKKQLYTAIVTALALGASVVMSSHAQEGDIDPVPSLDVDIVLVETPVGDGLPGDIPEVGELPEEIEPLPTLPEGIALDNDGNSYPEGGPAGLYNAIVDKQQKLGMTGIYDNDGNLVDVIYEGGNYGQQNALSRLRANLERKLNKDGLTDDGTEVPEVEPLPDEVVELAEVPEVPEDVPTDEPIPALPEGVAFDSDGNAYPDGGPAGLYNAITDKQQKLGMEGVYDVDGNLESVSYEGGNSGQQNALSRLRANLERKLKKLGLFDEAPDVPDTGDLGDTELETLAVSAELGISSKSEKVAKVKVEKNQKPEKALKIEKVSKIERVEKIAKPVRVERVERPQKPTRVTRVERPQRPEKISRVEKPQRPEKVARVEKPQRPEKVARVEKPQRPEKPQKPVKPERPGGI
jgi:hypothetical protein